MKAISLKVLAFVLLPTAAIAANSGGGAGGGAGAPAATGSTAAANSGSAAAGAAAGSSETVNTLARKAPEITASMLPDAPSQTYGGPVMVGNALSGDFTYYPIPNHDPLSYAVLNHQKVVVDRESHRIVKVIP